MSQSSSFGKRLYRWIRSLHLFTGLFVSPFILVYAVTAIIFNHAYLPWDTSETVVTTAQVEIPDSLQSGFQGWKVAKKILDQVGVTGEIGIVRYRPGQNDLRIPVFKAGQRIFVDVDLETRIATVDRKYNDVWDSLIYLHRMPGPHNVRFPPNWIVSKIWAGLADSIVYLILFGTASGVYLWAFLKAERKLGLALLAAGLISLVVIALSFIG